MEKAIHWKWAIGHALIIYLTSIIFGFVAGVAIGLSGGGSQGEIIATIIGLTNILSLFLSVALISIFYNPSWKHLFAVWMLVSVMSLSNMLLGFAFFHIVFGAFIALIPLTLGHLVVKLFRKLHAHFCHKPWYLVSLHRN